MDDNASRTRYFAVDGGDGVEITRCERVTTETERNRAFAARYRWDGAQVWTITLLERAMLLSAAAMEWK